MMNEKEVKYNRIVVTAALDLLERPGMTIDKLRTMREDFIKSGGPSDELDQMYYDAILSAIEMMTRPMFE